MASGLSQAPDRSPEPRPDTARSRDALERVARTLGVPVTTFFPDEDRPDAAIAQAADLVSAFVAIENPAARRTCLAFVRAMSSS
ncbi:hypothetical protein GOFOIKOB_0620 [Methylobacterium tardum]|jgi:hypothetical protein|uniref:Uncharacterized protein n=1 Tax=Methylobacterium tardum TaxID=374432 RepID=A0AA37TKM4_9HYPH|nr:hypothetical protein [Methylobacterium tardum]URD36182.1 hypothetical protein M6G65_27910 [Methylobacterium tardum]GJE47595.1 hypothetical protein GOFOIKOB_0620 [Methylobacterium tardum]GLS69768.1 hypothetical protein GCM10007890_17810 [Methylobacterium tardum]